ncbi:MAG: DUF2298 domain-containing protein, partial [Chloroflexota bacterium]
PLQPPCQLQHQPQLQLQHQPLPMYNEDTAEKYQLIRETLRQCDYVVLATNRLWRTIPRLPERYPMSTRYYEALFSGELGFEQVHTVETHPRLGPFVINDQAADESFTVYDHPKPILFQKTRQLTVAEWDAILGDTWVGAIPGYTGQKNIWAVLYSEGTPGIPPPPSEEEANALLLSKPVDELPVVNDFRWNRLANNSPLVATVLWWFIVMAIGMLAVPITVLLFHKLPDRGYGLSKALGLLLVSYFVWINSSLGLLSNSIVTVLVAVVILAGLSLWIIIKNHQLFSRFFHEYRWLILITETIFIVIYLFFVYLRVLNPDLWQPWLGGEKMLEIGFLNAVVKSANMPPYDPYFAGGTLNYYYYGLFLAGVLIKLSGIAPTISFNLAIATLAAITAINVFSLTRNLSVSRFPYNTTTSETFKFSSVFVGLLGILFVVFLGNLEGMVQLLRDLSRLTINSFESGLPGVQMVVLAFDGMFQILTGSATSATYNYWDPTRVIPQTINEFPYFSFLFADLHPHMIGIPFTVLLLSLAYNWLRPEIDHQIQGSSSQDDTPETFATDFQPSIPTITLASFLRWLAIPFVLGAIAVINTWDLPT